MRREMGPRNHKLGGAQILPRKVALSGVDILNLICYAMRPFALSTVATCYCNTHTRLMALCPGLPG